MRLSVQQKKELVLRYTKGESVADICHAANISRSSLYNWVKQFSGSSHKATSRPDENIAKLKLHLDKCENMIKILQSVHCTVHAPLKERLYALEKLYGQYSVYALCEALQVDRGTFYNHLKRNKKQNTSYQIRRTELSDKIKEVFDATNGIYGANKIRAVLNQNGTVVGDKMVEELMGEMNLSSSRDTTKKQFRKEQRVKKEDKIAMSFHADAPNQIWVSDTSYYRYQEQNYYICVILDIYSRKAIAYKISKKHSTQLISATFKKAYAERMPPPGLIFHSDRGSQHTSHSFQILLKSRNVEQSFSPPGSPRHNAVMESFFANLKKEELYRVKYRSISQLYEGLAKYIDFYNSDRPHTTLKYSTPNGFEAKHNAE